jgi:hypothetical protein
MKFRFCDSQFGKLSYQFIMSVRLKLPPHMVFHHDLHLLVVRPRGVLNRDRIEKDLAVVNAAEDQSELPFNRFTDLSNVTQIHLEFGQAYRIALNRRIEYEKRPAVKSAIYMTRDDTAQLAKMCATVTNSSPLQIQVFKDVPAAAQWLGVPDKDLQL